MWRDDQQQRRWVGQVATGVAMDILEVDADLGDLVASAGLPRERA